MREVIRAGADVIKIMTSGGVLSPRDDPRHGHFRDDEIAMMVAEATAAGLFVMSHAQAADGIKAAVRNGVRSIEHGIYLDDEGIELMLERGAWLVPTLVAPRAVLEIADAGGGLPPEVVEKARMVADVHTDAVRRAVAAGVKIAMGTDSGVGAARQQPRRAAPDGRVRHDAVRALHARPDPRPSCAASPTTSARSRSASAPT